MGGMAKLMARAGKGLAYKLPQRDDGDGTESCTEDEEEEDKEPERPFEPLCVWKSPHLGGEAKGLPSTMSVNFIVFESIMGLYINYRFCLFLANDKCFIKKFILL